ncbi:MULTISPECIES: hypothetical protein [Steroidobacteraceae]|uniref:hypothetical protein n=1 Tax=Steroidobacteraceae TaxID=2689614 RepID=UPI00130044CC|nr:MULTISPECIES: hypothetical protein [Steroidobacteraceae]
MQSFVVVTLEVVHRLLQKASIKGFTADRAHLVLVGLVLSIALGRVPDNAAREISQLGHRITVPSWGGTHHEARWFDPGRGSSEEITTKTRPPTSARVLGRDH